MYALVLTGKQLTKLLLVDLVQVAEPLADMAVKWQVCPILHATLNDHVAKFDLLARADLQFEELVAALFKLDGRHNDQVDSFTKLNKVFLREILDLLNHMKKLHVSIKFKG